MSIELIKLPYENDYLEPYISKETIEIHHGKHHKKYVDTLNELIQGTYYENLFLEDILRCTKRELSNNSQKIFNNCGQVLNHNLYFTQFDPNGLKYPIGNLGRKIRLKFGGYDEFKTVFEKNCNELFGSGWVWLVSDDYNNLSIKKYYNGENPIMDFLVPLLGFDVWEHAYYLDYKNKKEEHFTSLWNIVDWNIINEKFYI